MTPADKRVSPSNTIAIVLRGSVNVPGSSVKVLYSFVNTNFSVSGSVWSVLRICVFCVQRKRQTTEYTDKDTERTDNDPRSYFKRREHRGHGVFVEAQALKPKYSMPDPERKSQCALCPLWLPISGPAAAFYRPGTLGAFRRPSRGGKRSRRRLLRFAEGPRG